MNEPASDPAVSAHSSSGTAVAQHEQKRPTTYAGLHEARSRGSSASGQRRGGRQRPNSGQPPPTSFVLEGRQAPLHPKPQTNYQQWQFWDQQQQMYMMQQQQQWQASGYPVFGQYATHDGSSPRADDPNAFFMAQLIQQGEMCPAHPHNCFCLAHCIRLCHDIPACTPATAAHRLSWFTPLQPTNLQLCFRYLISAHR